MYLDMMVCGGILMGADEPVAVTMIKQREYVFLTNVPLIPYTQAKHFDIPLNCVVLFPEPSYNNGIMNTALSRGREEVMYEF